MSIKLIEDEHIYVEDKRHHKYEFYMNNFMYGFDSITDKEDDCCSRLENISYRDQHYFDNRSRKVYRNNAEVKFKLRSRMENNNDFFIQRYNIPLVERNMYKIRKSSWYHASDNALRFSNLHGYNKKYGIVRITQRTGS